MGAARIVSDMRIRAALAATVVILLLAACQPPGSSAPSEVPTASNPSEPSATPYAVPNY